MPPPGSPPQSTAGQNTQENADPYYSNEDVAVLHDIVVLAQELLPKLPEPERLPTNALFSAYYDILPRIGINADHDNRYARVLFKIGGLRGQGTLYEKFEEILSRMGIEIEFDHEDSEEQYSQLEDSQIDLEVEEAVGSHQVPNRELRGRQRRNSESSAWDLGNETSLQRGKRRNSFSHAPHVDSELDGQKALSQAAPVRPAATNQTHAEHPLGHNIGAWLNSGVEKSPKIRGRSISTHASMRIRRRSVSLSNRYRRAVRILSNPASDDYQAASEATGITTEFVEVHRSGLVSSPQDNETVQERDHFMQIKASLILQHQRSFLSKRQLRLWRDKAVQLQEDNFGLSLIAANHDKLALLHSALGAWRLRLLERRRVQETERFFTHLERRATKARDLYLLQLALTYWYIRASEQAERTAVARRHIVRYKIFNAWQEFTAVNQLKARRHVLKKFFFAWQRQHFIASNADSNAVQSYETNVVERIFQQWVLKLWDVKAVNWRSERAKRQTLFRWIVVSHSNWEKKRTAEKERRLELLWNAWRIWRVNTKIRIQQDIKAEITYSAQLCQGCIRKWRSETRVIPAKQIIQEEIATRLLREGFGNWLMRTRQETRATKVDRVRILREGLTTWRHKLRHHMMITRVNDRAIARSFYAWMRLDRSIWANRERAEHNVRTVLRIWKHKSNVTRAQRLDLESLAEDTLIHKTQDLILRQWCSQLTTIWSLEATALELNRTNLLKRAVSAWSGKFQHLQRLNHWSRDAEFYFLASSSIERWKCSTETAKRNKRKAAYGELCRITKINLAKRLLEGWRSRAQRVLALQSQAISVRNYRDVKLGMDIFDQWRTRAEELAELDLLWREPLSKKHLSIWRQRSETLGALNRAAIFSYQERRQNRTLKKWSLISLQIRAQENYAADVRDKNIRRRFRKMLTFWHQQTVQRRPTLKQSPKISNLRSTARVESWPEIEEDDDWPRRLDQVFVSTSLPGYLATPSKRTERVMAVAARFSTTPKAPLSTPFERQLRAQWSSNGASSTRRPPARSGLGVEGFPDVLRSVTKK